MLTLWKSGNEAKYLASIIFIMVLVGYPIFAGITLFIGVESNFLSIIYRIIILIAAILLLLISWLRRRPRVNYKILIGAGFLFFYIARMLLEWLMNSQGSKIDWGDFWSFLIFVSLIPALPYVWKENIPDENFTTIAIVLFGIIGIILNFYLAISVADSLSFGEQLFSGRLESERLNPIAYGHLGASTALVGLWMMIIKKNMSFLAIIGAAIGVLGIFASGSRGPLLSFVVCLILMLMQFRFSRVKFIFIFSVILSIFFLLNFVVDFNDVYLLNRAEASMFEDDARVNIIGDAYRAFLNNMLIGAGYPFDVYPHNIILEAFMASGIIGGSLMVFTLMVGLFASMRVMRNNKFSWVSLLFVQYLTFSMVSNSIYYSNIFWMLWVCVVILGASKSFEKTRSEIRVNDRMAG
ncbi:O-antigen ligase family protein [Comamonas flocculans]|uniref:O-antigen ligase family protein n=1 Tax=Comamonas flocculans TaxID=2597701 RepID=A0A5B8RVV3_9BURK|nr:O-antigen ligase family protein [Comamonas flocculans]QEA13263.1 O-antigen ligase family protein [Comamonas flocculans]